MIMCVHGVVTTRHTAAHLVNTPLAFTIYMHSQFIYIITHTLISTLPPPYLHTRRLTMPSGECIQLSSNVTFIFECTSLIHASPATVSRCGLLALTAQQEIATAAHHVWLAGVADEQQRGSFCGVEMFVGVCGCKWLWVVVMCTCV